MPDWATGGVAIHNVGHGGIGDEACFNPIITLFCHEALVLIRFAVQKISDTSTSTNDPIFFLHHTGLDRL